MAMHECQKNERHAHIFRNGLGKWAKNRRNKNINETKTIQVQLHFRFEFGGLFFVIYACGSDDLCSSASHSRMSIITIWFLLASWAGRMCTMENVPMMDEFWHFSWFFMSTGKKIIAKSMVGERNAEQTEMFRAFFFWFVSWTLECGVCFSVTALFYATRWWPLVHDSPLDGWQFKLEELICTLFVCKYVYSSHAIATANFNLYMALAMFMCWFWCDQ